MGAFDGLNDYHLQTNLRAQRLASSLMPVVEMFMSFSLAATIIFGGRLVLGGTLGAGQLVQFTLYIQRFYDPIRSLTMQFTQLQRAMASGARIFDLLDTEPDLVDAPDAVPMPQIQGAIRYENVSFEYEPGKEVLSNVNLDVEPGETIAFVGRTGAGKTTMAALVSRFYDVVGGRITIDGYDVRDLTRESLAKQMGIVLQEPFQFSGTIMENIRYNHPEASDETVYEAAKAVGLHDHIASLRDGYETMMEERGGNMSLGQRQLVSFARALVADPRIIVLDEATASVGHPDRTADPAGDRQDAARSDGHRHRSPALHHPQRGQDRGDGEGPHRGDWRPRRTGRARRSVRTAVRTARAPRGVGREAGLRPDQRVRRRGPRPRSCMTRGCRTSRLPPAIMARP